MEDVKVLVVGPHEVDLRWRLGDEAIDAMNSMDHPLKGKGVIDGYADLRGVLQYSVERRDAFSSQWYTVADNVLGDLTAKVKLRNCPTEMYGNEYRVTAWLNNQPCAPSRPARIPVKTCK